MRDVCECACAMWVSVVHAPLTLLPPSPLPAALDYVVITIHTHAHAGPTSAVQLWTIAQGARVGGEAERLYVAGVDLPQLPSPATQERAPRTPQLPTPFQSGDGVDGSRGAAQAFKRVNTLAATRRTSPTTTTPDVTVPSMDDAGGRVWVVRGFHHPALYVDVLAVPLRDVTWGSGAVADSERGAAVVDGRLQCVSGLPVWVRFRHTQHANMCRGVARVMSRSDLQRLGDGMLSSTVAAPTPGAPAHPLHRWRLWQRAEEGRAVEEAASATQWLVVTCAQPQRGVARGQVLVLYADEVQAPGGGQEEVGGRVVALQATSSGVSAEGHSTSGVGGVDVSGGVWVGGRPVVAAGPIGAVGPSLWEQGRPVTAALN